MLIDKFGLGLAVAVAACVVACKGKDGERDGDEAKKAGRRKLGRSELQLPKDTDSFFHLAGTKQILACLQADKCFVGSDKSFYQLKYGGMDLSDAPGDPFGSRAWTYTGFKMSVEMVSRIGDKNFRLFCMNGQGAKPTRGKEYVLERLTADERSHLLEGAEFYALPGEATPSSAVDPLLDICQPR